MSVSGVTTYQLTANQIVNAAMRKIGIMAKGQVADAEELTYGIQALNTLIPILRTRGMPLWKLTKATLSLVANTTTYTISQPNKAFKINQAWITPNNSGTNIPVELESIFNYNLLPTTSSGVPIKLAYIPANTTGTLSVWPAPSAAVVSTYTFYYMYQDEFDIIVSDTDTVDFPAEWHLPLIYGLAYLISGESNVPIQDRQELQSNFDKFTLMAEDNAGENASIMFQPYRGY